MLEFWAIITFLGDPVLWTVLGGVFAVLGFLMKERTSWGRPLSRIGIVLLITLMATFLAVDGLKEYTDFPRPCIPCEGGALNCNPYCLPDKAFPSGHAATATVVAMVGILRIRPSGRWLLALLPVAVGASRLGLGVHTPLDVLGGFAIGIVISLTIHALTRELPFFTLKK